MTSSILIHIPKLVLQPYCGGHRRLICCSHSSQDCSHHCDFHCSRHRYRCCVCRCRSLRGAPASSLHACGQPDTCHRWRRSSGRSCKLALPRSPEPETRIHRRRPSGTRGYWLAPCRCSRKMSCMIRREGPANDDVGKDLEWGKSVTTHAQRTSGKPRWIDTNE